MLELAVDLDAYPLRPKVRLRVAMFAAIDPVRHGLAGPLQARVVGEVTTLWLGPDQWLLVSDTISADALIAHCIREIDGLRHHVVDVSAGLRIAHVRGGSAAALLSMGSGVDWTKQCVRIRFASIPVIVHRYAQNAFDVYYDRSYGDYLERWMAHSLRDPLLAEAPCLNSR